MTNHGWIKTYRKMVDWEWFKNSSMVHIFIYLIIMANHADSKWQGHIVKRGQLVTGRKKISADTGISEQSIRTCLKKLENSREITQKSTNKFSIITVCNYEKYQPVENDTQPTTNQQLTNNQPTTNHKQEFNKKNKNKENTDLKDLGKKFSPPTIEEIKAYCQERKNSVDPEKWINHYQSKGWMIGKNKMKDWRAAVRTWESSDQKNSTQPRQRQMTVSESLIVQREKIAEALYNDPDDPFNSPARRAALRASALPRDEDDGKSTPDAGRGLVRGSEG